MEQKALNIRLNFRSKQPLAEQIADSIRQKVLSGALQPEEPLPPVRELAAQLKINFNTVARAYRILDFEGYCSTQRGRGTFILDWREAQEQAAEAIPLSRVLAQRIAGQAEQAGIPLAAIFEELETLLEKDALQSIPTKVHPKLRPIHTLRRVRNVLHPPLIERQKTKKTRPRKAKQSQRAA